MHRPSVERGGSAALLGEDGLRRFLSRLLRVIHEVAAATEGPRNGSSACDGEGSKPQIPINTQAPILNEQGLSANRRFNTDAQWFFFWILDLDF